MFIFARVSHLQIMIFDLSMQGEKKKKADNASPGVSEEGAQSGQIYCNQF